jgi:LPXTG-motif cell wall-anchored protein
MKVVVQVGLLVGLCLFIASTAQAATDACASQPTNLDGTSITHPQSGLTITSPNMIAGWFATGGPPLADATTGTITGALGYPSDFIPPLRVYAIRIDDSSSTAYSIQTELNQGVFTMAGLPPGDYHVLAYYVGDLAGGYTVGGGTGTDHTLIPVTVRPGETTSGVEVRDWYAPPGTFPPEPETSIPVSTQDMVAPYEATVPLRILDAAGNVLIDATTTASGSATVIRYGSYVTFNVSTPTPACIQMYHVNAATGEVIVRAQIPVTLAPSEVELDTPVRLPDTGETNSRAALVVIAALFLGAGMLGTRKDKYGGK